jgi:hypothetical protein
MKLRLLACGFAAGLVTALVGGGCLIQDEGDKGYDAEEMHNVWEKFGTPNQHHEKLKRHVGEWDIEMRSWWEGPDREPQVNHAVAHTELIFGGRFLKSEMKGTIKFELEGKVVEAPIEGMGITGYDTFKRKYVSVWIDSHGTAIHHSEGTLDPTGTVYTYFGTSDDWMTGQHDKPQKFTERWLSEDKLLFEMHDLTLSGKTKVFEMTYTRRPATAKKD